MTGILDGQRKIICRSGAILVTALFMLAGLVSACSTTSSDTIDDGSETVDAAGEGESEASLEEELVYGDLSSFVETWPQQMEWSAGPFEEVEVHELSGEEVREVLEGHGEMNWMNVEFGEGALSMKELVEKPGAVGFHFVGEGEPLDDLEALFIPFPEAGPGVDGVFDASDGLGFMAQIGVAHLQVGGEIVDAESDLERWPELDEASLGELLESGERFVIYQHMTNCPCTPRSNRWLAGLDLPDDFPLYVDHDFEALDAHFEDDRLKLPSSSFVAFSDGDWIDLYPGMLQPLEKTFGYFVRRAGIVDDGPTAPVIDADAFGEDVDLALALTWRNYWTALDLEGADLQGMRVANGAISGMSFREADLQGANFSQTLISHSDFEGATVDGAMFDGAVLQDVTCVDGEVRSGAAAGCLVDIN